MSKKKIDEPRLAIMACWAASKFGQDVYLSGLRAGYVEHFSNLCSHVYLVLPTTTLDAPPDPSEMQPVVGGNVTLIPLPALPSRGAYLASLQHVQAYYRQIKSVRGLVTHFYCQTPDPFCWLPAFMRIPRVTMHHVGSSVDATWRSSRLLPIRLLLVILYLPEFFAIWLASLKSRVVCNGRSISKRLSRYGIQHRTVISSTINESDLDERRILNRVPDAPVEILYVGFLRPSKGLIEIIQAAAILKKNGLNFRLRLIGDGEERISLVKMVEELGLASCVVFEGHVDNRTHLREFYSTSDLFVFMSKSEGSPRVVVEAMASSLLVLSTRVGSLPSVFTDSKDIIFVEHTAEHLASLIIESVTDRIKSNTIAASGYARVKNEFMQRDFISALID